MLKITFMGAGSTVFARNVIGDVMCTPSLRECEVALYDIDPVRLDESSKILSTMNNNVNEGRMIIRNYLGVENRKDALRGANFVVNAIQVGGYKQFNKWNLNPRLDKTITKPLSPNPPKSLVLKKATCISPLVRKSLWN